MAIEILQNDNSLEHQRQLVAETLPELESFIIIGRRSASSTKSPYFASCSFSETALASAIANFLCAHPHIAPAFAAGYLMYADFIKSTTVR